MKEENSRNSPAAFSFAVNRMQYDRIKDRDEPAVDRRKRPWETVKVKAVAAKKSRA